MDIKVNGTIMTITIDTAKEQGISKSGKSMIIASTGGNVNVAVPGKDPVKVGLNVYRPVQQ